MTWYLYPSKDSLQIWITRKPQEIQETYEQLAKTEKQAYKVASVTSGLKSPTNILKCPDYHKIINDPLEY